jgi:TolB-like protein/Flp pilus assembly protein TadD
VKPLDPEPEPVVVEKAVSRAQAPSIAIIPFQNLSQDVANEPFTMGIHDDLLTKVSKIGTIRTISRTSVLRYSGSDKSIPEIAEELGVENVLEGGVQRVGNNVRINVQLIDAATDEHLWAETYDRELSAASIFAIQSEIATAIANALKATLSPDDERRLGSAPTDNLEALEAYFIGKQLADMRREDTITDAIGRFDSAISLDPQFALAHAGLAYAWLLLPEYSATVDRDQVRQEAERATARALELDPDLPEGLTVMAWNRLIHDYDWATAENLLRDALQIHPANTDALHWLSHVVSWQGRHVEALQLAQEAVDNDPFSPVMYMNLAYILMDAGDFDRSVELREATLRLRENLPELWRNSWLTLLRAGRYEDATFAMSQWAKGVGRDVRAAQELGHLLEGFHRTGEQVHVPIELLTELKMGSENLAQVYAAAGDGEAALAALAVALDERAGSRSVLSMKINPLYDFIRDDPRFGELMKSANLSP